MPPRYAQGLDTWTVENRFTIRQQRNVNLDDISRTPFYVTDPGKQDVPMHYVCNLQVVTDQDGTIKTFHAQGNEGCQRFVTALDTW
jgi:hypothetical protein